MFPLRFNDGRIVPRRWLGEAVKEIRVQFGAVSYETQQIEGQWFHGGTLYQEKHVRLFVDAPRERRLQRLAEQRGWNVQEVDRREKSQWPLTEKLKRADGTLDNSGSREELARQVQELIKQWGITDRTSDHGV